METNGVFHLWNNNKFFFGREYKDKKFKIEKITIRYFGNGNGWFAAELPIHDKENVLRLYELQQILGSYHNGKWAVELRKKCENIDVTKGVVLASNLFGKRENHYWMIPLYYITVKVLD